MGIDERDIKRTTEDLHFQQVEGPEAYHDDTEGPVDVVTVATERGPVGFLWAADADDAAGFLPCASGGDDAMNAGVSWYRRLREAKQRGLAPSQALTELAADPGGERIGRVVAGSAGRARNLTELKALASTR